MPSTNKWRKFVEVKTMLYLCKGLLRVVRREYLGNKFKIWILDREIEYLDN